MEVVKVFECEVQPALDKLAECSKMIGFQQLSNDFALGVSMSKEICMAAENCCQPNPASYGKLLKPLFDYFRELTTPHADPISKHANHFRVLAQAAYLFMWFSKKAPAVHCKHVHEIIRILQSDFDFETPGDLKWVEAVKAICTAMENLCSTNEIKDGLKWQTDKSKPAFEWFKKNPLGSKLKLEGTVSLDDEKWHINGYLNWTEPLLKEEELKLKHGVYILNCRTTVVQVPAKVATVVIERCEDVGLVVPSTVSTVEILHCKNIKVQVTDKIPCVSIDNTQGVVIWLSKESLDVEIVASLSSDMNVSYPNDEDEMVELAVPAQFVSRVKPVTKKIDSKCTDLYGY